MKYNPKLQQMNTHREKKHNTVLNERQLKVYEMADIKEYKKKESM